MNINKALEHYKWRLVETDENGKAIRLKGKFKPTARDLEAYNAIVDFKDIQDSLNMSANESLAKLWIHQLILLNQTGSYNGERSIQIINEILEKSVYEWCKVLKYEIPMMRFNSIGNDKYPMNPEEINNFTKLRERRDIIVSENETELTEALKYEISEKDIIKFVEKNISRIINEYEK